MRQLLIAMLVVVSANTVHAAYSLQAGIRGGTPGQGASAPNVWDATASLNLVELDLFLVNDTTSFGVNSGFFDLSASGSGSLTARTDGNFLNLVNGGASSTVAPFQFRQLAIGQGSTTFSGGHYVKVGELDVQLLATMTSATFQFLDDNADVTADGWSLSSGDPLTGAEDGALYASSPSFSVVPEPSAIGVLGLGLVGLASRRRRRA